MLEDGTWDVRVPASMSTLFPKPERRGYYYKIGEDKMRRLLQELSDVYQVRPPKLKIDSPKGMNGAYTFKDETARLHTRNHIKTVVHEFYHHLDGVTGGKYDSDDRGGGPDSFGWQFAEKWWDKFREEDYHA